MVDKIKLNTYLLILLQFTKQPKNTIIVSICFADPVILFSPWNGKRQEIRKRTKENSCVNTLCQKYWSERCCCSSNKESTLPISLCWIKYALMHLRYSASLSCSTITLLCFQSWSTAVPRGYFLLDNRRHTKQYKWPWGNHSRFTHSTFRNLHLNT